MNDSKISVRYAKALFLLGKEQKLLQTLKKDMSLVQECSIEVTDFYLMLESPVVKTSSKQQVVKQIFSGKVDAVTLQFLDLVIRNSREAFLKAICRNFLRLCRVDMGVKSAQLTSAAPIDDPGRARFLEMLKAAHKCEVELQEQVDENLIGGFVLRVEDKQLDASVANQLSRIKRQLLSATNMEKNS